MAQYYGEPVQGYLIPEGGAPGHYMGGGAPGHYAGAAPGHDVGGAPGHLAGGAPGHHVGGHAGWGAGSKWIRGEQTKWVLHEDIGSVTGDDFTIKDAKTGRVAIKAKAKALSSLDDITLLDVETGEELCTIKGTFLNALPTYLIQRHGVTIATVRKARMSVRRTVRVYKGDASFNPMTNETDAEMLLQMHGNLLSDRNTEIYRGDTKEKVAHARERRFNAGGILLKDEYDVKVEAGADIVLILASMIVKDEIIEEKRERRATMAAVVCALPVVGAVAVAAGLSKDREFDDQDREFDEH